MAIEANVRVISTAEAATLLGVKQDTVRKWIQRGLIKPAATVGQSYLLSEKVCRAFKRKKRPHGNPAFSRVN